MKKTFRLLGFILIIFGMAIAVFTFLISTNPLQLMQQLIQAGQIIPEIQQYISGILLAIIFIVAGVLLLKE